jgi:superkiller protein 3
MEPQVRRVIREAREAVLASPESAAAWGRLGEILDVHEIDAAALAAYAEAIRRAPEDPRWPYFSGRLLAIRGTDLEAAAQHLQTALTLDPEYAPGHLRLADVRARQGELAAAAAAYRRALELDPNLAKAHQGLGQVRLLEGNTAAALDELGRARELAPEDGSVWAALAQAWQRAGDPERAAAAAEKASRLPRIDTYPDPWLAEVAALGVSSSLALERGQSLLAAGRPAEAAVELEKVVAARPDDPFAHLALAAARRQAGQLAAAIPHYQRALELDADLPEARLELGLLLAAVGRTEEAVAQLRRVAAGLGPGAEAERARVVRESLGRALLRRGDVVEALAELERAEALGPLSAEGYNDWGSALAQQGRFAEAAGRFRRALEVEPGDARAWVNLGLAHEGLGRPREALEYYRKALEIQPDPLAASRIQALQAGPGGGR